MSMDQPFGRDADADGLPDPIEEARADANAESEEGENCDCVIDPSVGLSGHACQPYPYEVATPSAPRRESLDEVEAVLAEIDAYAHGIRMDWSDFANRNVLNEFTTRIREALAHPHNAEQSDD